MSIAFDPVIKLGNSRVYVRLVLSLNLFSMIIILHSSLSFYIQLSLLLFVIGFYAYSFNKSPCPGILGLHLLQGQCNLIMQNGQLISFSAFTILIANPLFQLIYLSSLDGVNMLRDNRSSTNCHSLIKKKLVVIFNDQLSLNQLRILHVKAKLLKTPMLK